MDLCSLSVSICVLHWAVSSRHLCSAVCSAALLIESLQPCEGSYTLDPVAAQVTIRSSSISLLILASTPVKSLKSGIFGNTGNCIKVILSVLKPFNSTKYLSITH